MATALNTKPIKNDVDSEQKQVVTLAPLIQKLQRGT